MPFAQIVKVFTTQVHKLRWTFVTVGSVLALAYVMNLSDQTLTIGKWIAGVGTLFAFFFYRRDDSIYQHIKVRWPRRAR